MPFEHGSFAVTIFSLPEALPENYLELFSKFKAGGLDSVKDEPQIGWASGQDILETEINEGTAICGGMLYLGLRKVERKVPAPFLNAVCKHAEAVYKRENHVPSISSKEKKEIKEKAIEENIMKVAPAISSVPMVIDLKGKLLYLGANSPAQIDLFLGHFHTTFNMEPEQITPDWYLANEFKVTAEDLPNVVFSAHNDGKVTTGRDFLTWLWYFSEQENGGTLKVAQYGEFGFQVESPLTFAVATKEASGAAENTLKNGNSPLRAAEAKAALTVGKKLRKAKFILERGEDIWSGAFDADRFSFSGLMLPEGEEMEPESRFEERIRNLYIFNTALGVYFRLFVKTLMSDKWGDEEEKIRQWVDSRETM
ncbi:MAG: putative cytosolic protein [Candidatus Uhrbacteria bacterium GW2011_GWF2_39_13]|uniref:Putative cytosolic protein n=1 Tax=Candidatus Uhrbacteria bacterium GW2011_GWF2_39_13 TaxID=1618995 RepID=A0A0G0MFP9_9BACT|nr:MAG: putative cytosolic protein [Candidatus Uhrbacteria bacterium GW2011_GWF2_39_13]